MKTKQEVTKENLEVVARLMDETVDIKTTIYDVVAIKMVESVSDSAFRDGARTLDSITKLLDDVENKLIQVWSILQIEYDKM